MENVSVIIILFFLIIGLLVAYAAYHLKKKDDVKKESSPFELSWWWWILTGVAIWILVGAVPLCYFLVNDPIFQQAIDYKLMKEIASPISPI